MQYGFSYYLSLSTNPDVANGYYITESLNRFHTYFNGLSHAFKVNAIATARSKDDWTETFYIGIDVKSVTALIFVFSFLHMTFGIGGLLLLASGRRLEVPRLMVESHFSAVRPMPISFPFRGMSPVGLEVFGLPILISSSEDDTCRYFQGPCFLFLTEVGYWDMFQSSNFPQIGNTDCES